MVRIKLIRLASAASLFGGRQLDGVLSTAKALPPIAEAVGDDLTVLVYLWLLCAVGVLILLLPAGFVLRPLGWPLVLLASIT